MNERTWSNLNICGLEEIAVRLKLNTSMAEIMSWISHNILIFPRDIQSDHFCQTHHTQMRSRKDELMLSHSSEYPKI